LVSKKTLTKEMSVRFSCWDFHCFQSSRMKQRVYRTEIVDVFGLLSLNFFLKYYYHYYYYYYYYYYFLSFVFSFLGDQIIGKSFIYLFI
jgi:hypothetical protein